MKFLGKITVLHFKANTFLKEKTKTVFNEYFEAPSLQAAKAKLTKIANTTEIATSTSVLTDTKQKITGKDFRWRSWTPLNPYHDDTGKPVNWCKKHSEQQTLETEYEPGNPFGIRTSGAVVLYLYWRGK